MHLNATIFLSFPNRGTFWSEYICDEKVWNPIRIWLCPFITFLFAKAAESRTRVSRYQMYLRTLPYLFVSNNTLFLEYLCPQSERCFAFKLHFQGFCFANSIQLCLLINGPKLHGEGRAEEKSQSAIKKISQVNMHFPIRYLLIRKTKKIFFLSKNEDVSICKYLESKQAC